MSELPFHFYTIYTSHLTVTYAQTKHQKAQTIVVLPSFQRLHLLCWHKQLMRFYTSDAISHVSQELIETMTSQTVNHLPHKHDISQKKIKILNPTLFCHANAYLTACKFLKPVTYRVIILSNWHCLSLPAAIKTRVQDSRFRLWFERYASHHKWQKILVR